MRSQPRFRFSLRVALALGLLLVVTPGRGNTNLQQFEGATIQSVRIENLVTLTEDTLLFYLGLEEGGMLAQSSLNASIKELWETGLIDNIEVKGQPVDGGVALTVTISERPRLRAVEYVGLKRVSRTDVEDRMAAERIRMFEGDSLRLGEVRRLEQAIEELYREKGYRFADAEFSLEDVGSHERRLIFTIDEGNRVRIEDIKFEGNTVYSDWRLRLSMRDTKETGMLWRLTKKDIYNPARLEEDLESVKNVYRKLGYKNVTIGDPVIQVQATKPNKSADEQKRRMFITIPIEEGERWKFGKVTFEGNEKYTDEQLQRAFQIQGGDWLRSKKVEEGVQAVEDVYKNTGHIGARIATEIIEREERTADLQVNVFEGDQFRVGRIDFEGNTRTRDKVLRRELRIHEGLVMSLRAVQNSLLKIKQLGYFKVDEEDPVQIRNVDEENNTIDLLIKGVEADRTELQFGGGWSEFEGFFAQVSLRTQNFLGRGETLGVQIQTGRQRELYDLSYFIPWFLDKPQSLGFRAFQQEIDFDLFSGAQNLRRLSRGGSLTYGRNFGLFSSGSLTYSFADFEDTTTFLVDDGMGGQMPVVSDLNFTNSTIRPTFVYNSVDSPFEPTRGQKLTFTVDLAGGVLGGEQDFVRPQLSYLRYQPVSQGRIKTVLGINAEVGTIIPYDDYEFSRLDRFYLGGDNSIRGHDFRSISVRNDDGTLAVDELGIALGGDKFVQLNLEYHFLTNSPFRFLLFADAAAVYGEDQSIDLSRLRYTAGVEARVLVPLFGAPLRFIYAQNLDPLPEDRFKSFDFTVGASF